MKDSNKLLVIRILSIIGLLISVKLCMIYYSVNFDKYALPSFCSINNFVDCDGVARTRYSQFLGVPLSYWGVLLYVMFLFLTFKSSLSDFCEKYNLKAGNILSVFKSPISYISVISAFAFACSVGLAVVSFKFIHKICILCFVTYFIDLFIAITASDCFRSLWADIKKTFADFVSGIKSFPRTFIFVLILSVCFLTYTTVTLKFAPSVKKANSIMKYRNIKHNPYRVTGNVLGNPAGNVRIELYSDFVCPLCYINNIMLHQAVSEYNNIYVIHHNYPFDTECNRYVSASMHPGACFMSQGAIAAQKQGNYWGMGSLLYEKQPKNKEDMLKLADELGFDKGRFIKDMESNETKALISKELDAGDNLDIDATPTMYINGKKYVGVKPYYELTEILEENGAVKK